MTALTQKEWFLCPKTTRERGSPFYFIWKDGKVRNIEPDDELKNIRGEGSVAVKEFLQWYWINDCDKKVSIPSDTESIEEAK